MTADPRRRPPRRPRKSAPRRHPLDPARGAAFDVLRAVSERDAYANLVLPAMLRERGIVALPDFVCNAGAVIGYRSAADATPDQVLSAVEARIGECVAHTTCAPDSPSSCIRATRCMLAVNDSADSGSSIT